MQSELFKVGDKVRVLSDTMELIVPVTEPATYVELYEDMEGIITEIYEDFVEIQFIQIKCEFDINEFEDGFLEVIRSPLLALINP